MGSAILGYKMLELPIIELKQVYRQALESPIIRLAHRILSGKPIVSDDFQSLNIPGQLTLHPWKKKLSPDLACATAKAFFNRAIDHNLFNTEEDIILCPFNKGFGTIEINKYIAQHLAVKSGEKIHEIIAGFTKVYLHVGVKVLYDKEDAIVTQISHNGTYYGTKPQKASLTLDYWGFEHKPQAPITALEDDDLSLDKIDAMLAAAGSDDTSERVNKSSHVVTIKMLHDDTEVTLDTAAEINNLLIGYALTVHKSQGSEWRKVFIVLHESHNTMIQRELLYTAVTRAREELYIICEPTTFVKGVVNQRIKGNTLQEKAIYFQGKLDQEGN
jgi:ATP-dependent exoDNAse (exonuclease V) alpha subunit